MADRRNLLSQAKEALTEHGSPTAQRIALVLLCLAIYVPCLFRGFIDPDETRYAEIVREMVDGGDWIVPHLNYVPYFMKPPLAYWVAGVSVKWFGFHPLAMRLGPLLAAILGVLATYELGAALGSRRTGLIAGALLATSIEYYLLAVSFVTDMMFSACLFTAWWAFWRHYQQGGRGRAWIALFWLFAALACFTKGPLGPALLIFTIGLFLVLRGEWAFFLRVRPVMGAAIFALVNVPWMVLIYRRDPRYLTFFYLHVNLAGIKNAALQHAEPFYYYLKIVPAGLLPWTIPAAAGVLLAVRAAWRQGLRSAPASLIWLLSMFVGGFVLLSIPAAKLATYSLPLFSSAALITADYLVKSDGRSWVLRGLVPLQSVVAVAMFLVLIFILETGRAAQTWQNLNLWLAGAACVVSLAGTVVTAVAAWRQRIHTSMMALGITVGIVFPLVIMEAPRVARWRSSQGLCEQFKDQLALADLVIITDSKEFSVPLTLRRRVAVLGRARELGMGLFVENQPADTPIPSDPFHLDSEAVGSFYLLNLADLGKVWTTDRVVYIFADDRDMERIRNRCPDIFVLAGNGERLLLTNRNPAEKQK